MSLGLQRGERITWSSARVGGPVDQLVRRRLWDPVVWRCCLCQRSGRNGDKWMDLRGTNVYVLVLSYPSFRVLYVYHWFLTSLPFCLVHVLQLYLLSPFAASFHTVELSLTGLSNPNPNLSTPCPPPGTVGQLWSSGRWRGCGLEHIGDMAKTSLPLWIPTQSGSYKS